MKKILTIITALCAMQSSHSMAPYDYHNDSYESEEDFKEKYAYSAAGIRKAVRAHDSRAINRICTKINTQAKNKINTHNAEGDNALELAIKLGYESCVEILENWGADIHSPNPKTHRTPLALAASRGEHRIVQYLLEHGAEDTATNREENPALVLAMQRGHFKCVKLLLDAMKQAQQAAPFLQKIKNRAKANPVDACLMIATEHNQPQAIHWLTEHYSPSLNLLHSKIVPDLKKPLCRTPLMQAVLEGNFEAAQALIVNGADVNTTNATLSSPLSCAIVACKPDMVDLLIEHGARLTFKDPSDDSSRRADISNTQKLVRGTGFGKYIVCYHDYLVSPYSYLHHNYRHDPAIEQTKQALLAGTISSMVTLADGESCITEEFMQRQAIAHMAIRKRLLEKNLFIEIFSGLPAKSICNVSTLKYIAPYLSAEQLSGLVNIMPITHLKMVGSKLQGNYREAFLMRIADRLLRRNYHNIAQRVQKGNEGDSLIADLGSGARSEIRKLLGKGKFQDMKDDVRELLSDTIKDRHLKM